MGAQAKTRVLEVVAATIVIAGAVALVGWFASLAGSPPPESDEEDDTIEAAVETSIVDLANGDVFGPLAPG